MMAEKEKKEKQEMTQKERLIAAARRSDVDRPPCICPGGMMNMISADSMELSGCGWPQAHSDPKLMARLARTLNEAGGFENYGVPFCMTVEAEAMGAEVCMGDTLCEPHVTKELIGSVKDWGLLRPIDLSEGRPAVVLEAIRILKREQEESGAPVVGNLCGPVSLAGTVTDMSILLKAFRKDPAGAGELMDFAAENLIAFGKAQLEAGADVICISEPSGTGEILGPALFEAYTVTYLNRILDALSAPVKIVHICGNLKPVYEHLPKLHCDIFSFDAIVSIDEMRRVFPGRAIMGNISTHAMGTMPAETVKRLARRAAEKGIDVLAPACGLPVTTPLANIQAMVKAVREK